MKKFLYIESEFFYIVFISFHNSSKILFDSLNVTSGHIKKILERMYEMSIWPSYEVN
jgi:hypothetical protein